MKGYVHIYTGDGKGKTTAALGLALRAAGAGLKVFFAQFLKNGTYSEHRALERFSDLIQVRQYGRGCFVSGKPKDEDIEYAKKGLEEVKQIIGSGKYDLVVLDEINIAVYFGLIDVDEVLELIRQKPANVELVLTGRRADSRLIEVADLVTEMKEVKHYYKKGVLARVGIEK